MDGDLFDEEAALMEEYMGAVSAYQAALEEMSRLVGKDKATFDNVRDIVLRAKQKSIEARVMVQRARVRRKSR